MDPNDSSLKCSVNVEWSNAQGVLQRKVSHKSAVLRLIRNEFRLMFVEISSEKNAPLRLQLKGISVHKNFMNEGKASIKFQEAKCTLYLYNAPTGQLIAFLRTLFVKMTGEKASSAANTSLRKQLLSSKPKSFEEISPVTVGDLNAAKAKAIKVSKATTTTPSPSSRKRKLEGGESKGPSNKRLYSSSPLPEEPLNPEQKQVFDACLAGHNVFFTGSAGTGKSYLLRKIIAALPPDYTTATASTGKGFL